MISKTLEINNRIFNFDISHLMHSQFTQYKGEDKQHFNWHPDGGLGFETDLELMDDLIFRKLTTVVCLSDHTDYEHGDFILFDGGVLPEQAICLFKMTKGEAIIFPAFMMHKVNPVTSGKRISLVNWFCGPRWR
jgi:PKHD-type hydroxylase